MKIRNAFPLNLVGFYTFSGLYNSKAFRWGGNKPRHKYVHDSNNNTGVITEFIPNKRSVFDAFAPQTMER